MTSVNRFFVTIEVSQTYLDTALVKASGRSYRLTAKQSGTTASFNLPKMDIWKVGIELSVGLPLSVDLTVMFQEDWTSKSKLLVEFISSSSIKNGRPAVFPMSV